MDPKKHPLVEVADLVNAVRPGAPGMWCLYVHHHLLDICLCQLVPKDAPVIARINSNDINTGLTGEMWRMIEAKIRTLLKLGVLEWQPPKP